MSKRLQVLLPQPELERFQHVAASHGVTLAAWVRRVLNEALVREPLAAKERKLSALRAAAEHSFPAADIEVMLAEIEAGRGSGVVP